LGKPVGKEDFTWPLRTKEGDGFIKLILKELERAGDFVDVLHVAKRVAEKLRMEPTQAFRSQIRYRLNSLFFQGKVERITKKGERGFFLTNYYRLAERET